MTRSIGKLLGRHVEAGRFRDVRVERRILQKGRKPVVWYGRVYLVILLLLLIPVCVMAGTQLNLEWDPNPEPVIAGYRVRNQE